MIPQNLISHWQKKYNLDLDKLIWIYQTTKPHKNIQLKENFKSLEEEIKAYKKGYPVEYFVQELTFCDQKFKILPGVLIPREETESWVKKLPAFLDNKFENYFSYTLVDLACGSGVIGISLANYFKKLILLDIDPTAIKNSKTNLKSENCLLLRSDLLSSKKFQQEITNQSWVLVSNLPYVPDSDYQHRRNQNIFFEPAKAIFAGEDGLDLFRRTLSQLKTIKKPKLAVFELDPRNIKKAQELIKNQFKFSEIRSDQYARPRVLYAFD